jgi:hypothetical protein
MRIDKPLRGNSTMRNEPAMICALVCAIAIGTVASASAQQRWAAYANPRFGTTIDYPADLFARRDPPPANGDGQAFRSRDGRARLAVWGAYNVNSDSPQQYVQQYIEPDGGITYRQITARYFAVSGLRKGDIFYQRCNFSPDRDGVIDCFEATYPEADKTAMDAVVARLSRSLRSGSR